MKVQITLEIKDDIDLEHMMESVSDATFASDNVTQYEQALIIQVIGKLINQKENYEK